MTISVRRFWMNALALVVLAGCGSAPDPELVRVDIDKSNPDRLLRYYLASYVPDAPADPFEAGALEQEGGTIWLDPAALQSEYGDAVTPLVEDGTLDWDELEAFIQETYYDARALPPTRQALADEAGLADSSAWLRVDVDGVMTTARRHVYAPRAAVRAALEASPDREGQLIYPVGTTFIGEHVDGDRPVETTVMRKRADGFWDFFTYGPDGALAPATAPMPKALNTPTQCFGCHYGSRLNEPEKSFPAAAPDGPNGPRAIHVPDAWRDADLVRHFDEHRRRSDGVLGLYATLLTAQLRAERAAGTLSPTDAALLDRLGL